MGGPTSWVRRTLCAVAGAALVTLAGCQGKPHRAPDSLVLLNEAPLANLDPRLAVTAWDVRVSRLVAPGLIAPGMPVGSGLAASMELVNERTWDVTLRSDVRFSNGRPVDGDDVVFTFSSILDASLQSPYRAALAEVLEGVERLDGQRVRFHLRMPRASFSSDLQLGIVARPTREGDPHTFVGAGPYQLVAQEPDRVTLVANAHAPSPPSMKTLIVRTIRDDNARVMALFGGSADAILNGVTPQVLQTAIDRQDLRVLASPSATVTYLGFQTEDPILRHHDVRRALAMAIDRKGIVEAKYVGNAVLADSLLDPSNPFHADDLPSVAFDPDAAARLLDAAGFRDPDGAGPRPRFSLVWKTSNNRFRLSVVQAMARQLARIGVDVDVRPYEFATFMHDLRTGNFQLFTLQMSDVIEPDWLRAALHGSRIPKPDNTWSGLNRFRFRDADVDAWLEAGATSTDVDARKKLYAQVQRRVAERLPVFPLWHEHNVMVLRRDVLNVHLSRLAGLDGLRAARRDTL